MTSAAIQFIRGEHAALRAMLQSLRLLMERGPGEQPGPFFEVLQAMLFYIDEFPERLHHPNESAFLFPKVARLAPELADVIGKLEAEHVSGEARVRELQHRLLAWRILGDSRRAAFEQAARDYIDFYLHHMRVEESLVLPAAERVLSTADWEELDEVFSAARDPFAGGPRDPAYDRLFTRIVMTAPAPIGLGPD